MKRRRREKKKILVGRALREKVPSSINLSFSRSRSRSPPFFFVQQLSPALKDFPSSPSPSPVYTIDGSRVLQTKKESVSLYSARLKNPSLRILPISSECTLGMNIHQSRQPLYITIGPNSLHKRSGRNKGNCDSL